MVLMLLQGPEIMLVPRLRRCGQEPGKIVTLQISNRTSKQFCAELYRWQEFLEKDYREGEPALSLYLYPLIQAIQVKSTEKVILTSFMKRCGAPKSLNL